MRKERGKPDREDGFPIENVWNDGHSSPPVGRGDPSKKKPKCISDDDCREY
jgi:hypothetical protein